MTRHKMAIGAVALGFTLSALPVWAQRPSGEGGGPRGGGESSGSAVARPGGGDAGGSGGGGSVSSGGGSSSSSSGGSSAGAPAYVPAPSRAEAARERAPQHPRVQRRGGGDRPRSGEATGRAVPRGTAAGGGEATSSSSGSSDRNRDRAGSPRDRAVPAYSRPRDGRTVTGRVMDRTTPIPDRDGRGGYYYSPYPYGYYYDPYGYYGSYWYPGYALGLGYFYYDPYWYGSYGGYGYQGYGSGRYSYGDAGALRLKIKPRDAQVFVDGYFVGNVDSFDGVFQRLNVEAGAHKIEIRAPGYETLQFDVLITPGDTVTYKGDLERIK